MTGAFSSYILLGGWNDSVTARWRGNGGMVLVGRRAGAGYGIGGLVMVLIILMVVAVLLQ